MTTINTFFRLKWLYSALFLLCVNALHGQTIAEKKAGGMPAGSDLVKDLQKVLVEVNKELIEDHAELHRLYGQVNELFRQNAPDSSYKSLLDRINQVRTEIDMLQNNWREMATQSGTQEGYALWHQPESTLGQLVADYGSQNYVYLMTPEIAAIPLSVDSNIPIPRSSWNEMLELILNQNGIGYKQLNPYLRQLYFIKQDRSSIQLITNKRHDLEFFAPQARIAFMLTPEPAEVRRVWAFLDKFVNPNSTVLQVVGRDILIIASAAEILDVLKLYDFISANRGDKEYKIKTVTKVDAEEMAKILGAIFDQFGEAPRVFERSPSGNAPGQGFGQGSQGGKGAMINLQKKEHADTGEANGLRVIALKHVAQAVFLIGTKKEIEKAEEIVDEVEDQVGSAREKKIWWYTTKNADPEELAQILEKIYNLMVSTGTGYEQPPYLEGPPLIEPGVPGPGPGQSFLPGPPELLPIPPVGQAVLPSNLYKQDFYQSGNYVVNPEPVEPLRRPIRIPNQNRNNFIVDLKTGAIVMVVEADLLPKIKELIKKLDVPKKMVQIEVLAVEKRLTRNDEFGLNLFRFGDSASNKDFASMNFNSPIQPTKHIPNPLNPAGIFEYILSQKAHSCFPAFDLVYKFLINQTDVRINANPTLVTVNQVPAKFAIVEEITLNMGATLISTNTGVTPQNSFTRAQYGTTITITPTIHTHEDTSPYDNNNYDEVDYVTLDTDIIFDTIGNVTPATLGQPPVTRRKITNQVNIPDGETVVIGGLRQKQTDDGEHHIPFLGEIPGFGKLFSLSNVRENVVELIIFITPRIIRDPADDFMRLRAEEMLKRPGDIPEFMCQLYMAQEAEKNRLYAGTMNALLGPPLERCVPTNYYRDNAIIYPYVPPTQQKKEDEVDQWCGQSNGQGNYQGNGQGNYGQ
ncbi:MAG: type II secretion system protein GspD [Parachlamydia sp.]|nr:type II secretion system protein GspD [Parachlamydia sp.]